MDLLKCFTLFTLPHPALWHMEMNSREHTNSQDCHSRIRDSSWLFFFLQRPRFTHALSIMLLLFPVKTLQATSERGGSGGKSSDDVTVSLLVCLLLLLLVLLFLAWRRLSQKSEGRYHPQRLLQGMILQWRELRGEALPEELSHGYQDEKHRDEELGEKQQVDMGEEGMQLLLQQEDNENEEEEEEAFQEMDAPEPAEEAGLQEASEKDGATRAAEGSAEALLSDLHSFSGTAAWEDSSKHLHVTAL
ncbi:protein tyrosine phosphatase receptor type C-associated protein [Rhineura floridana]|uniref:protein tyrosine phosphatase receptor type C-associated protein n=1 Tax=Rhineura floridana TaxID=261503 RepID=UPI002AC8408F|nr:protein tyrosine phosphatase receptor type C-associated protein [Rhineura floridana]